MDAISPRRAPLRATGFRADVLRGLAAAPKRLPSKYLYDATGSALFEDICVQPEYYPTRAETEILQRHGREIAAAIGPRAAVVEYGCGAAAKTRLLLQRLRDPVAYLPIEISRTALDQTSAAFAHAFPQLPLQPVCADFTRRVRLPVPRDARRTVLFFPGSTLGNFDRAATGTLLRRMRRQIGEGGCVLIGIDLQKDVATLEAAYNDAAGVTARFTLNLLTRINRELGADFDVGQYAHRARYNAALSRIDTHIVSRTGQTVRVAGQRFAFAADEAMLVEYSCKYSLQGFAFTAARAGLSSRAVWTDAQRRFAVVLLERAGVPLRTAAARQPEGLPHAHAAPPAAR